MIGSSIGILAVDRRASLGKECTPGVVPYVDMPLQHASGAVLKRMGRGMDRSTLTGLLHRMRDRIPDLALRTTLIVGFPGETDDEFEDLLRFVSDVRFERLGAFLYSPEDGTPAFRLKDDVPDEVKEERYHRVMELQREIAFERNESWVGRSIECLIEAPDREPGRWLGRTFADAPEIDGRIEIRAPKSTTLAPGHVVTARVTSAVGYDLEGDWVADTSTATDRASRPLEEARGI